MTSSQPNSAALADYIAQAPTRELPDEVLAEARKCLIDWTGVCLASRDLPEAHAVGAVARGWGTTGCALMFTGGTAQAGPAALVNGTLSHCLDYDDTHIPTAVHVSGPVWATVLALGAQQQAAETLLLKAFATGFQVAARLGDRGVGVRLNDSGWHATSTLGMLGAAAAASMLMGLDRERALHAMGIAATEVGGLTASFGTMAKPFHPGKAAMDAILAAQLAAGGLKAATGLFDGPRGVIPTLLQDREMRYEVPPLDGDWEILRNSFKPYAACQLAHAAIDGARAARARVNGRQVERIVARVHPLAIRIAAVRDPQTVTEAKFSTGFCIALGLEGHAVTTQDFSPERLADARLRALANKVEMIAEEGIERTATRLEFTLSDGEQFVQNVEHAYGSIGNPMTAKDLDEKFLAVAGTALDSRAAELLGVLQHFERPGSLAKMHALCTRD